MKFAIVAALLASPVVLHAQRPVEGCYRLSRPLGVTGSAEPVARDAAFATVMLRARGYVLLPEVAERERLMWERASEWRREADSLTLLVFTGLAGWHATLRPSGEQWTGRAEYLTDVRIAGAAPLIVSVSMESIPCQPAWRDMAPAPMRVSPSLAIYFENQVDREARLRDDSPLPVGAQLRVAAGVPARTVMVQFVIDSAGRALPNRVKILKSDADSLSQRVHAVVEQLRFAPAVLKGQPVAQLVQWVFVFPSRPR